jgi:hypothetical protein
MPKPKAMSLKAIRKYVPEMRRKGVSVVARSPRGFLTAYARAGGRMAHLTEWWRNRRLGFIKRHMAQVHKRREKLWKGGKPSRRALALIAWAYMPRGGK